MGAISKSRGKMDLLWPSSESYSSLAIHLYHFLSQVLNSQPGWISYFKMSEQMVTSKELSRGGDVDKKLKLELNIENVQFWEIPFLKGKSNLNNKGPFSIHPNTMSLN